MEEEKKEEQKQDSSSDDKSGKKKAPIIIKRITAGGHGHHGGAWKVAYADFVTAMMAFFLLLWLLNSTPSDKLQGIAQYFEPTVGLSGQKGIGFEGGKSQNTKDGISSYDKESGVKYGVMSKGDIVSSPEKGLTVTTEEVENERFTLVEGELKKVIMSDGDLAQFQDNISFEITPEGLMIKITDQEKYPMFKAGSADLSIFTKNILSKIVGLIQYSPNFLQIAGHTDSNTSAVTAEYSNWELSVDRANQARRYMVGQGIPKEQIARVVGKADSDPLDPENPGSPRNRRITITLLRNSIMPFNKIAAPKELLSSTVKK
jgi:chemotaxis protein MotB